ncbi:GNVR domain-containing protein [Candidatus Accumulibacter phosphatis]|uniref:GNVR domain-containing protein n=1 Tax=Candidatus Accumulibacter phosphatis TaxID=327160 RepID=UPI003013D9C7
MLDLKIQRDEIDVLAREVETAQRGFDAIGQRMTQSKFESQSLQTNIAILTPASQPLEPSKPKLLLNLLVSVFLGTLLGIGAALLLELAQRRVRSADDLAQMLDLPVLAALGSALTPGRGKGRRFSPTSRVDRNNPGTQLKISEA